MGWLLSLAGASVLCWLRARRPLSGSLKPGWRRGGRRPLKKVFSSTLKILSPHAFLPSLLSLPPLALSLQRFSAAGRAEGGGGGGGIRRWWEKTDEKNWRGGLSDLSVRRTVSVPFLLAKKHKEFCSSTLPRQNKENCCGRVCSKRRRYSKSHFLALPLLLSFPHSRFSRPSIVPCQREGRIGGKYVWWKISLVNVNLLLPSFLLFF